MTGAACAQTINWNTPTVKSAVLGSTECIFWLQGIVPGQSQWAVYVSGVLGPHPPISKPANGTAILPCPAPLDNFEIAVGLTGAVTARIKPLAPQTYADAFVAVIADGVSRTLTLPSVPASPPSLQVSVNGLIQTPGIGYTLSGRVVTFTVAPAKDAELLGMYK